MLKDFFKKTKYAILDAPGRPLRQEQELEVMTKCDDCGEIIYHKDFEKNLKVCSRCGYHLKLTAPERLSLILDKGSFTEYDCQLETLDPLEFPEYSEKLAAARELTGLREAVITGEGKIEGIPVVIAVMDQRFITA
ncbi:MAG: acetyl-CoA carboxylase carboxyl transferase subunit beta, partial [Firmicutes bacterium HGW-Firmicutes-13]